MAATKRQQGQLKTTRTEKFDKIPVHVFSDAHCAVPQQTTLPKHLQIKATTKALYFPPGSMSDKGCKKMTKRWQQGKQQRWQKRWQKRKQQKVAKRWQKVAKREQKRWQKRKQKRWKKVAKPHLLSIAMHLKSGDNWTTSAHLRSGQKSTHLRNCHLHLPNIFCIVGTITYVLCFCTCQIYCRHNYLCFMFLNLPDILYCRHNYFVSRFCNCQIFCNVDTIT